MGEARLFLAGTCLDGLRHAFRTLVVGPHARCINLSTLMRQLKSQAAMPYSHHSHSGQFCGHAKDTLEEVVQAAIAKGFHTFALTEHIPRLFEDFYPEEVRLPYQRRLV